MSYGKNGKTATKLKRKTPDHMFEPKFCKWCGGEIVRKRHVLSQWNAVKACSASCASLWAHHQKSRDEMPPEVTGRRCLYCHKLLVQRENECTHAWNKRQTCNKSHASYASKVKAPVEAAPKIVEEASENKLGLIRYIPGTPEFEQLAKHYLARGF